MSNALDVPLEWFFRELVPEGESGESASSPGEGDVVPASDAEQEAAVVELSEDGRNNREALMVFRALRRITNPEDRKALMNLIRRFKAEDS